VRLAMRDASTLILGSRRVVPTRLLEHGMIFRFTDIEAALRDAL
jgi:NAD dependent epimerase/dehydratase family enzyme